MPGLSKQDAQELRRLMRDRDKCEPAELARRMLAIDPSCGAAYGYLAAHHAELEEFDEAERLNWKALELTPCSAIFYFAIAQIRSQRDPGDALGRRLHHLALWKLAMMEEIPEITATQFGTVMEKLDPSDPESYEILATTEEIRLKKSPSPPEVERRLLPYVLLNDLQWTADTAVAYETMRGIIDHAEECIPVLQGALRQWTRLEKGSMALEAACLVIALLGEIGPPGMVADLLDLAGDNPVFLHVHWAIHRLAVRYPAEVLAAFRAATPGAPIGLRCALAEQINLMPETPGLEEALPPLVDGYAKMTREDDAPHLLLTVVHALDRLGRQSQAQALFARLEPLLPKHSRRWIEEILESEEGFVSSLDEAGLDGLEIDDVVLERALMADEDEEDEDEEDEEEDADWEDVDSRAVAELHRPAKPGRNEPCWCGSGKKYKKCHLNADQEPAPADQPEAGPDKLPVVIPEIVEHATRYYTRAEQERAKFLYFQTAGNVEATEDQIAGFAQWLMHDFRDKPARLTAVEHFLEEKGRRLGPRERAYAESLRDARYGVFEVQGVEEGRGLQLKDLYGEDTFFVNDVSSSRQLVRWDCIVSRVHTFEGKHYFAGHGTLVARDLLAPFKEWIDKQSRASGQTRAEFVRANSHRLHRIVADLHEKRFSNLKIVNKEGDTLEFSEANYQVLDEPGLLARLRKMEAFVEDPDPEEPGERHFGWLEAGGEEDARSSFGHIRIRKGRLRLECNSRKRLKTGRRLLEASARACLKHLGDSFESVDAARRRMAEEGPPKSSKGVPPEVEREILLKMKAKHYATWPDEKLPALGGKTPRQAVKTQAGRALVLDIVRGMENGEERQARDGMPAFDFTPLRRTLGLDQE